MFSDIVFVLTKQAAGIHEQLIRDRILSLLPETRLRIIWDIQQLVDTFEIDVIATPQVSWLSDLVSICPKLRWLHLITSGSERIFEHGLHERDLWISKSPGVNSKAVSEYVIGAILFFAKQFHVFRLQQRKRQWHRAWLEELSGKKAAILGLGHVGQSIARYCALFGMHTVGISRGGRPVSCVEKVFRPENLPLAVAKARFLIVTVPLTPLTGGMIGIDILYGLEKGSFLIDVSRGGVVSESAIVSAIQSGHLGGAALDVFESEPLSPDSALWDCPNVLLTPHVAGTTDRFMERALNIFEKNLLSLTLQRVLATPVDIQAGY